MTMISTMARPSDNRRGPKKEEVHQLFANAPSLRYLAEEAQQQDDAVKAATLSLSLENDRYKAGTDSYLNVITTQTILLNDQQTAVGILQRRMTAAVDLIKAMGGGWDSSTLPGGAAIRSVALADPKNTEKVAQPSTP